MINTLANDVIVRHYRQIVFCFSVADVANVVAAVVILVVFVVLKFKKTGAITIYLLSLILDLHYCLGWIKHNSGMTYPA